MSAPLGHGARRARAAAVARAALVLPALGACGAPASNPDSGGDARVDAADQGCVGASCPVSCTPGTAVCTDDARGVATCGPDGASLVPGARCDAARGELCEQGRCVLPCDTAAAAHSYLGCEFYATATLNSTLGTYFPDINRDDFPLALALTNPWPVPVGVSLESGGLGAALSLSLPPGGAGFVPLPWNVPLVSGDDAPQVRSTLARGGSVRVRATAPIAAYQFNPVGFSLSDACEGGDRCFSYTNDASLLLPAATLGRQYVVASWPTVRSHRARATAWTALGGFVAVVGVSDAPTDVTVHLRGATSAGADVPAGAPGGVIHQRLARGDVLQLVTPTDVDCATPEPEPLRGDVFCQPVPTEDLTGSVVEASAPVAVFAGHDCALVPYNRDACDHLEEQLFPVESLGTRYLVARTPPALDEPNVIRVIATRPGTTLTVQPAPPGLPAQIPDDRGYVEFTTRAHVAITASQPVLVAEYLVGALYEPSTQGEPPGDPDMVLAVPADQYRSSYTFASEPGFEAGRAIAVVPRGEQLVLDGRLVDAMPSGSVADHDVYYLAAGPGFHRISAAHPAIRFGLVISGLARFTSYTYPAGLDLAPISPPL